MSTQPDGTYAVSNSEIQTWMRCKRKWWLSYDQGYGSKETAFTGALTFGSRIHDCLERQSTNGENPLDVWDELSADLFSRLAQREADDGYADEETRKDLRKEHELGRAMLEGFLEWAEETGFDENYDLIAAETVIEAPSGVEGMSLRGKLDQRVRRRSDGALMFRDWKCQPLTEPVLTPDGWVTMGSLRPGDSLLDENGNVQQVRHVYDRGDDDVYEIALNDGTVQRATADHIWLARDMAQRWRLFRTDQLKPNRHRIASFQPDFEAEDQQLPIPPYTLGMWLANGSSNGYSVCDGVLDTMQQLAGEIGSQPRVVHRNGRQDAYRVPTGAIRDLLGELGLLGLSSCDRFIPSQYILSASPSQRMELLHGLMDGDGTLTTSGSAVYHTTSHKLAETVADLVRSLGGWARINYDHKTCHVGTKEAGYDTGKKSSYVAIRSSFNPFKNIAHAERWAARRATVAEAKGKKQGKHGPPLPERIVKSVSYVGVEPVRCIEVSGEQHLYVTRDWCLSHNTFNASNFNNAPKNLQMAEQPRFYALIEWLNANAEAARTGEKPELTRGGIFTMMKKVMRTGKAAPPFYDQVEVRHNKRTLESHWHRTNKRLAEIKETKEALADGGDHRYWVAPTPTQNCSWDCPFVKVCSFMDDSPQETWEAMLQNNYSKYDPNARYAQDETKG